MKILIKSGRIINPSDGTDKICDLLIKGSQVELIAENITEKADRVIDASGMWVVPGFIDLHVHLREPGFE